MPCPCAERGAAANLDLHRWRSEMHCGLAAARRIGPTCESWDPHVLHFHTQAAAYCSLDRMRVVPSIVSIDCTQTLAREEVTGPLARATYAPNVRRDGRVFKAARAVVSTSEWAAADLRRHYPEAGGRVRVMPYPVRLDPDSAGWIAERSARADRGEPVRFLFVGGDFPRKGGWDLLNAWRETALDARAALDIVTDWPVPPGVVPRGARMLRGIEPYSPEWRRIWRDADVFVMPTRAEAFGMVYQEAAAAGVPVVGTRLGAVSELVEDGSTGLLVPSADVGGLIASIRRLAADAQLRRRLGIAARERALSRWDLRQYGRALGTLILQCAATPRAAVV